MSGILIKDKIASGEFFCAPGIQDMITAVIAKDVGFDAVYASGYWMGASAYGLPDVGITTYTQMLDRVGTLVKTIGTAGVIADADTGYGGLLNVRETVRGFESAGAQVIQIEDQEFPKKCGHTKNKRIIPLEDMVTKIKVAVDSRKSTNTLISARTDCYQSEGFSSLMKRLEAYSKAGADIIFPEAVVTEKEMRQVCSSIDKPAMANMADGGNTPIWCAEELADIGFAFAIFPATASLSAAAAIKHALTRLKTTGTSIHNDVDLYSFSHFCQLIGFEDVWEFEKKWHSNSK
jgi:2-methylisocitrate lyase-like PEP mutase family enzyme